ncbi:MAG: tetratricopeptide repeat protein [Nitrospiraceae bacterium]|nr:tetratricopeptide repeat protein [Nitrospiraceae bacterium]
MRKSEAKKKYARAGGLHAAGRFAEALAIFEELSHAFPKNADILYARALALGELGRYDEAIIVCDMLTGIIEDPRAEELKARVLAKRERETLAAEETKETPPAIEEPPADAPEAAPEQAVADETEAIEEVFRAEEPAQAPPAVPEPEVEASPEPIASPVKPMEPPPPEAAAATSPVPEPKEGRKRFPLPPRYRWVALAGTSAFIVALAVLLLWPGSPNTVPSTNPHVAPERSPQVPALEPPEPVTLPPKPESEPEPAEASAEPVAEPPSAPAAPVPEPDVEPAQPETPPPVEPEAATVKQRVFQCPDDRAVGIVHIRDAVTGLNRSTVGPAKGAIIVPAGRELVLEIGADDGPDLSGLAALTPPELVTELVLTAPQVTDNDFAYIARFAGLRQLRLDSLEDFTGWGLARLADLPGLHRIEIANIAIGSDMLAPLAMFASLEELEINVCTSVAPDAFAPLVNVPALAVLDITGCAGTSTPPLAGALCADLAKLASLEELFIVSITEPALEKLEAALPRCNITAMVSEALAE